MRGSYIGLDLFKPTYNLKLWKSIFVYRAHSIAKDALLNKFCGFHSGTWPQKS